MFLLFCLNNEYIDVANFQKFVYKRPDPNIVSFSDKGSDVTVLYLLYKINVVAINTMQYPIKLILKNGNFKAKTYEGITPIHCLLKYGTENHIELMLKKIKPKNINQFSGDNILHYFAQNTNLIGNMNMKPFYSSTLQNSKNIKDQSPLHIVCQNDNFKNMYTNVNFLTQKGYQRNEVDYKGFTPLHYLCLLSKKDKNNSDLNFEEGAFNCLLSEANEISVRTLNGEQPLHINANTTHTSHLFSWKKMQMLQHVINQATHHFITYVDQV